MNRRRNNKRNYKTGGKIMEDGAKVKGFLISCSNHKEKFAVRDAYKIINQFYIQEYGDRFEKAENDLIDEEVRKNLYSDEKEEDKKEEKKKIKKFLSKQLKINAKGLVFIKIDDTIFPPDFHIQNFVELILNNAKAEKIMPSKDIFRFVPVEIGCKASMENFENFSKTLIEKFLNKKDVNLTWSMVFKCRCNSKFNNKYDFLSSLKEKIPENYRHLDYKGDITFFIDITQHFMCLSIFRNFNELKKFSFINLLNEDKPKIQENKMEIEKNNEVVVVKKIENLENNQKKENTKNDKDLIPTEITKKIDIEMKNSNDVQLI